MKTRSDRETVPTRLPPPPAPVARDANPWPMPEQQGDAPRARGAHPWVGRRPQATPAAPAGIPPRLESPVALPPKAMTPLAPPTAQAGQPARASRHGLARFVPLAIFLGILGSVATGAFEALQRGDRIAAVVPLIVVGIIAIGWWRSMQRARRR